MINAKKNILFTATLLALCVVIFVHLFLFPINVVKPSIGSLKNYMSFELTLCTNNIIKQKRVWKKQQCPKYGIVTARQGGRLGNQMWEYASVWAVARRTGLEPYIPRCMRVKLDQIFESLSVPTFEEIAHCPVDNNNFVTSLDEWNYTYQSIILPRYSVQPEIVLTWVQDIKQEFTFKRKLISKSQNVLRQMTQKTKYTKVYVGVHIRRTDYVGYLWRKHLTLPANITFYRSAMRYYEMKYSNVVFIVVSDDPAWCVKQFGNKQNVHITGKTLPNSPALDLAILASCNHSIIDYGTFGIWGAILAGGETIFYDIVNHATNRLGEIMPQWHRIT